MGLTGDVNTQRVFSEMLYKCNDSRSQRANLIEEASFTTENPIGAISYRHAASS